jgi:hypothetical protein
MSIKETKEQIAGYSPYDGWASLHSGDDSSPTILHISRLRALADSHTALLEAAKAVFEAEQDRASGDCSYIENYCEFHGNVKPCRVEVLGGAINQAEAQ